MPAASAASMSLILSPTRKLRPSSTGQRCEKIEQHAGIRLAPGMRRAIGGDASLRMVRTIAPIVDRGALGRKLLRHPAVEGLDRVLLVKPFGDPGLIGDDEHVKAGVVQKLHRRLGAADPLDLMRRMDIAVVDVEDPVAVEEDGRTAPPVQRARGDETRWRADVDEEAGSSGSRAAGRGRRASAGCLSRTTTRPPTLATARRVK